MKEWRVIAAAEPLLLLAITPLLLFPTVRPSWTAAALALLALVWLARAFVRREPWPVTPFNTALLLFCLSIPLAVWASASPELTLPKLTGLILGLAAFRVIAFSAAAPRGIALAFAAFAIVGAGMWALGLLGMKLEILTPLAARLPASLVSLPGAPDQGINPNQLAGLLVLYLPFVVALVLLALRERRVLGALSGGFVALAALATLIMTRSRAGWIGFAVATVVLLAALVVLGPNRRLKRALVVLAGVALLAGLIAAVGIVPQRLGGAPQTQSQQVGGALAQLSLDARIEIWSRALYALHDFPFTGVGLGAFRRVVNLLYPLFLVPPDTDIGHAHNIFLQAGVDLGLGGLVAYVALLLLVAVTAWETARAAPGPVRLLAVGLLASLVGLHVYGLADALALGSKPGLAYWMALGLVAALGNVRQDRSLRPVSSRGGFAIRAEGPQPLPLGQSHFDDVQQPVGDDGGPDAPRPQEEHREHQAH
jgi:putative inorganic carbon (HCO3(-)) transporter